VYDFAATFGSDREKKSSHGQQAHDFTATVGSGSEKRRRKRQQSTHGQPKKKQHFAATFSSEKV